MTYISLATRNSEIVVVSDMDVFARFFCYAKKQKQGRPVGEIHDDAEAQPSDVTSEGKLFEIDDSTISSRTSDEDDDI